MESPSLQNGSGRGKRYKREEKVVPTSPTRLPSAPKRIARAPNCPRWVSPLKNRRKKANLTHLLKLTPDGSLSPPDVSYQIVHKLCIYRPTVSKFRQAVNDCGACCLAGAWRWRPLALGAGFVSPGASCWHFCYSSYYSRLLICLDFWNKASNI